MTNKKEDRSTWAIGAMTLIGIGVGLIFIQTSSILFAACVLIGIGLGLLIASFMRRK